MADEFTRDDASQQMAIEASDCAILRDHMHVARASIEQALTPGSADDRTVHGIYLRALSWMMSICKLDSPSDFQPIAAGCRGLFEMAVDLVLLAEHPDRFASMAAWEQSEKLACAVSTVDSPGRTDAAAIKRRAGAQKFIDEYAVPIHADRLTRWSGTFRKKGPPAHPSRWTGENLYTDSGRAETRRPFGFSEFYAESYAIACWSVHGSGLAAVRGFSDVGFAATATTNLHMAKFFASIVAQLAMEHFKLAPVRDLAALEELHGEVRFDTLVKILDRIGKMESE